MSPKKPARTEAAMFRTGPRPTGSTRPNSPASIDQSPPSVPANPNDRAWPASGVDKAASGMNIGAMNRRTFVLLSGTASGSLLGSRAWSRGAGWIPRSADGRLVFSLDAQRRWTLSYHDAGTPVPLVLDAELAVGLSGSRWVPLADLEDVTVSRRSAPAGAELVVRGSTDGVAVEAAFADGAPGEAAAITVTLSPDRSQGLARGVRYCATRP